MNPKEKALKLCQDMAFTTLKEEFNNGTTLPLGIAKKCALICVDEILNGAHVWNKIEGKDRTFWNEVKIEIQNL